MDQYILWIKGEFTKSLEEIKKIEEKLAVYMLYEGMVEELKKSTPANVKVHMGGNYVIVDGKEYQEMLEILLEKRGNGLEEMNSEFLKKYLKFHEMFGDKK